MHPIRASFMAACVSFAVTGAAFADEGYANPDVIVNPSSGPGVLLYPGGQYGRVVRPLLQPGERLPWQGPPIRLHMPRHRVAIHHAKPRNTTVAAQAPPPVQDTSPSPPLVTGVSPGLGNVAAPLPSAPPVTAPPAPPKRPAKAKQLAATTPKPAPTPPAPSSQPAASGASIPFTLAPEENGLPSQTRTAKAEPPPAHSVEPLKGAEGAPAGLVKQSQIKFAPGAPDPSPDAIDAIKTLATPINAALAAGANTVLVTAYGGAHGDKSSEARRLSLKRALVIRQLLIDGGVPSDHINVRAMGGATDDDAPDRVDIFTKT